MIWSIIDKTINQVKYLSNTFAPCPILLSPHPVTTSGAKVHPYLPHVSQWLLSHTSMSLFLNIPFLQVFACLSS